MASKQVLNSEFKSLSSYCHSEMWEMSARNIQESPHRLESTFYGSEGYGALDAMRKSSFVLEKISDRASVQWFGPFARRYVQDSGHGIPFLSSSDMMEARPRSFNLISIKNSKNLDRYIVREDTILVSCSGTIGNVALVTTDLAGFSVSQHAIRVDVKEQVDLGPTYFFLQSVLGQFLVKRSMSGSVIQSIYEKDIADLPIPQLPRKLREELTARIREASALRVEANRLLDEANETVTALVAMEKGSVPAGKRSESFSVSMAGIMERQEEEGYFRLDATYYKPDALDLRKSIRACSNWAYLGVIADIVLIGKAFVPGVNKVESGNGVPYFTGKELFLTRIVPSTFITSKKRRDIDKLVVKAGMTLVTCAGTTGKVAYVGSQLDGATVTHDAMRIMPKEGIDGGYLYAFLTSRLGAWQLERCAYGSVIPRLHDTHLKRFVVPIPPDGGRAVGNIVNNAFASIGSATLIETSALQLFVSAISRGRSATELEWGEEY